MPNLKQKLTFNKKERLSSKILIDEVFEKGKKFKSYPFIATYLTQDSNDSDWESKVRVVITVPKRKVKFANKRNRVRRQIKEAYRLNKSDFYTQLEEKNTNLALFLIYIGKEKEEYSFIDKKIKLLLTDLVKQL
jgi:ribonuclease P protein component